MTWLVLCTDGDVSTGRGTASSASLNRFEQVSSDDRQMLEAPKGVFGP